MKSETSIHNQASKQATSTPSWWRAAAIVVLALSAFIGGPVSAEESCDSRHATCQDSCKRTDRHGNVTIDTTCAQNCTNKYLSCLIRESTADLSYGDPSSSGSDLGPPWSTVGSAAAMDESSQSSFYTRREVLGIPDSVGATTIVGRWAFSDERFDGKRCATLRVRYRDNGPDAAVYVRLIRSGINGGSSTRADFYSENVPQSQSGWQTQEVEFEEDFDLSQHAYFLETWIHKLGASGIADLGIVQLEPRYCNVD